MSMLQALLTSMRFVGFSVCYALLYHGSKLLCTYGGKFAGRCEHMLCFILRVQTGSLF